MVGWERSTRSQGWLQSFGPTYSQDGVVHWAGKMKPKVYCPWKALQWHKDGREGRWVYGPQRAEFSNPAWKGHDSRRQQAGKPSTFSTLGPSAMTVQGKETRRGNRKDTWATAHRDRCKHLCSEHRKRTLQWCIGCEGVWDGEPKWDLRTTQITAPPISPTNGYPTEIRHNQ